MPVIILWILLNDFFSSVFLMHMNIHCENHTAVTQMTDKAHDLWASWFYLIILWKEKPEHSSLIISEFFILKMLVVNKLIIRSFKCNIFVNKPLLGQERIQIFKF